MLRDTLDIYLVKKNLEDHISDTSNPHLVSVSYYDSGTSIILSELGGVVVVDNSEAVTITLPSVDSSHVGQTLEVYRIGAGSVTITTADSDTINASSSSIACTRAGQTDASIRLRLIRPTRYGLVSVIGSWVPS